MTEEKQNKMVLLYLSTVMTVHLDFIFDMNEFWKGETILMFCNIEEHFSTMFFSFFTQVNASEGALVLTQTGF